MLGLLFGVRDCFRSRFALQAEMFALRHQLLVLQRTTRGRSVSAAHRLYHRQEIVFAGFLASNREQRRDGLSCEKMKSCPSGGGYGGHGKN